MKKARLLLAEFFVLFIAIIAIGSLIAKDRDFSENENRYLAEMPKFTIEGFLKGDFQEDLENYLNDQVIGRDYWISFKSAVERTTGNTDIGGAYVGKDDYYFEKITPDSVDEEIVSYNTNAVRDFLNYCARSISPSRLTFMMVPTSGYVYEDKLPDNAIMFDQESYIKDIEATMEGFQVVSLMDTFVENNDQNLYYKTDHHWTSDGAFLAYQKWCETSEREVPTEEAFCVECVTEEFRGSLYSKVLSANATYDSIKQYAWVEGMPEVTMTVGEDVYDSIFFPERLEEKDKYKYFFGDNYAETVITNSNTGNETPKNLLVVKDSFANSFVPFLTNEYDHIYMIDLRYYKGDMGEYLLSNNITDVMVLYNISNFVSDKNVSKLGLGVSVRTYTQNRDPSLPNGAEFVEAVEEEEDDIPIPEITSDGAFKRFDPIVVIGGTGYEKYYYASEPALIYATAMNEAATDLSGVANVYSLLVPLSSEITYPDNRREEYQGDDQIAAISEIYSMMSADVKKVNVCKTLMQHRDEYIYYRTDHHWSARGAYYAYAKFCDYAGLEANALEDYEEVCYGDFIGSFYMDSNEPEMVANPDQLYAYLSGANTTMEVTQQDGSLLEWDVIHDVSDYKVGVKYSGFIAGDNPFSVITNSDINDGSACVVVKESFGNAFVPFLVDHYQYIYVVDYRYWEGNLMDLVREKGAKDLIFVNNISMVRNSYLVGKLYGAIQR